MKIEIATIVTEELVEALQYLIPQLTDSETNITYKSVEDIINNKDTFLFVAKNEADDIVGTLTLVIFAIPTSKKAFIEDVVVDDRAQGLGAGKALVEAAIELAKYNNVKKIELSSNPARVAANGLYHKLGFKIRETNFYRLQLK